MAKRIVAWHIGYDREVPYNDRLRDNPSIEIREVDDEAPVEPQAAEPVPPKKAAARKPTAPSAPPKPRTVRSMVKNGPRFRPSEQGVVGLRPVDKEDL